MTKREADMVTKLQLDLEYWKRRALAAAGEEGQTNTHLLDYTADDRRKQERGLPPSARIQFTIAGELVQHRLKDLRYRVHVHIDEDRGALVVNSPDGTLVVVPHAANQFHVRVSDRI